MTTIKQYQLTNGTVLSIEKELSTKRVLGIPISTVYYRLVAEETEGVGHSRGTYHGSNAIQEAKLAALNYATNKGLGLKEVPVRIVLVPANEA